MRRIETAALVVFLLVASILALGGLTLAQAQPAQPPAAPAPPDGAAGPPDDPGQWEAIMEAYRAKVRPLRADLRDQRLIYEAMVGNFNVKVDDVKAVVDEMRRLEEVLLAERAALRESLGRAGYEVPRTGGGAWLGEYDGDWAGRSEWRRRHHGWRPRHSPGRPGDGPWFDDGGDWDEPGEWSRRHHGFRLRHRTNVPEGGYWPDDDGGDWDEPSEWRRRHHGWRLRHSPGSPDDGYLPDDDDAYDDGEWSDRGEWDRRHHDWRLRHRQSRQR